jgi:hypothetical protein
MRIILHVWRQKNAASAGKLVRKIEKESLPRG